MKARGMPPIESAVTKADAEKQNPSESRQVTLRQGLTLAHFRAQLEDLRDTSLTLGLNLSTFETHSWVNLGQMGDSVSLS